MARHDGLFQISENRDALSFKSGRRWPSLDDNRSDTPYFLRRLHNSGMTTRGELSPQAAQRTLSSNTKFARKCHLRGGKSGGPSKGGNSLLAASSQACFWRRHS